MGPAGVTRLEPKHFLEGLSSVFVASGSEWFTASRSVAVGYCLTRLLKGTSERTKRERERDKEREREIKRESGGESIYLQEFNVITPTHVSS